MWVMLGNTNNLCNKHFQIKAEVMPRSFVLLCRDTVNLSSEAYIIKTCQLSTTVNFPLASKTPRALHMQGTNAWGAWKSESEEEMHYRQASARWSSLGTVLQNRFNCSLPRWIRWSPPTYRSAWAARRHI